MPDASRALQPDPRGTITMVFQYDGSFGTWLRAELRSKRMTQRQLAQRSGVDHSTISRLARGDRTPSLGTATKIARGLRVIGDGPAAPPYFGPLQSRRPATARVEDALRGDDALEERHVRAVMRLYLRLRRAPTGHERMDPHAVASGARAKPT